MTRLLLLAALLVPFAAHAELGINVYGLSYHLDRDKAHKLGVDNELNPGLGVRWRQAHSERLDWFADAGFYRDSGRNTAVLAGGGALWHATGGLRLGGAIALLHSDTYNRGKAFIAPLPGAADDFRRGAPDMGVLPQGHRGDDHNN